MKTIALTRGMVALVDDEDFEELNKHKWFAYEGRHTFYAMRQVTIMSRGEARAQGVSPQVNERMHRVIACAKPGQEVDHVDHNGLNNTRENLRLCTSAENSWNRRMRSDNKSGYIGVQWRAHDKKFAAAIGLGGKLLHIGLYKTAIEAARAYDAVSVRLHGEFARTNFNGQA